MLITSLRPLHHHILSHSVPPQSIRNRRLDEGRHVETCTTVAVSAISTVAAVPIAIPASSTSVSNSVAVSAAVVAVAVAIATASISAVSSVSAIGSVGAISIIVPRTSGAHARSTFLPLCRYLALGTSIAIVVSPSSAAIPLAIAVSAAIVAIAIIIAGPRGPRALSTLVPRLACFSSLALSSAVAGAVPTVATCVPGTAIAAAVVVPIVTACVPEAVARPTIADAVVIRCVVGVALDARLLSVAGRSDCAWAGG